jgi:shikimate 5-dehydrogenase
MTPNYKFELVGVLGFLVAENPTCVMQEAAFAALGLQWRYRTIEVKPLVAARRDWRCARIGNEGREPDPPA